MHLYMSGIKQRSGEMVLSGCHVAWLVSPIESTAQSVAEMDLSDDKIIDIITLLGQLFGILDEYHTRIVPDGEQGVCTLGLPDMNIVWEPPFCNTRFVDSEWPRDIFILADYGHAFAKISLVWSENNALSMERKTDE